jgi:hypothetical protein
MEEVGEIELGWKSRYGGAYGESSTEVRVLVCTRMYLHPSLSSRFGWRDMERTNVTSAPAKYTTVQN